VIFQKFMGKMQSFSIEGTHAPLTSELSYKVTSSLRHSFPISNSICSVSNAAQLLRHLYKLDICINSIQNTVVLAEVRHVTQLIDRSCDATDVILNESDHPHQKDLLSGEVSGRRAGVRMMMMMCGGGFMWAGGRISFVIFFI